MTPYRERREAGDFLPDKPPVDLTADQSQPQQEEQEAAQTESSSKKK